MKAKLNSMEGILYLTDDQNKKKYVQIDLEKYADIWEDFHDAIKAEMVNDEETIPLDHVIKELEEKGNLDKYV